MTALVTCAGIDVLDGELHFPARGAWSARLRLDSAEAPSGKVTVRAAGGFTLQATVQTSGVYLDTAHVRLVGGAGGLAKLVHAASFEYAMLSDPLRAVLDAAGETLSSKADANALTVLLRQWTLVQQPASAALDQLVYAAHDALGEDTNWRVLDDGTVWLGVERWPAQALAMTDVLDQIPDEGRYVLGVETPSLLPGVDLATVGHVAAVDHFLSPNEIRTHAWLA